MPISYRMADLFTRPTCGDVVYAVIACRERIPGNTDRTAFGGRNVRIADNPESYPEVPVSSTSMYMVALIVSVLVMTVVGVLEMKWR